MAVNAGLLELIGDEDLHLVVVRRSSVGPAFRRTLDFMGQQTIP